MLSILRRAITVERHEAARAKAATLDDSYIVQTDRTDLDA